MAGNTVDNLSPAQETAIIALLHEPTVAKAAQRAEIGERTLYDWLDTPLFRDAYHKARRECFKQAMGLVHKYAPLAVQTLVTVATDKNVSASARVAASNGLLKFSRESLELDDMAGRIDALERATKVGGR